MGEASDKFSVRSIIYIQNNQLQRCLLPTTNVYGGSFPCHIRYKFSCGWLHVIVYSQKAILSRKGWKGDTTYQFCSETETTNHLFLINCGSTQHIWFQMENTQAHFTQWSTINDIIQFALSLPPNSKKAFLIMFSALCWTL